MTPSTSETRNRASFGLLGLGAAALAGLLAGLLVWGLWTLGHDSPASSNASVCDVTKVASDVLPSVVTIAVAGPSGSGTGSGVVVRTPIAGAGGAASAPAGRDYVITNDHVAAPNGATGQIRVTYADGHSSAATLTGRDPLTDLAVVKVEDPSSNARPITVGDSADLVVGQGVVALGAPLGLSSTVTSGIVSATDRYVRVPSESGTTHHLIGAVQTDAAINPGNSGGALVDCAGQLVGINSAGAAPGGDGGSVGLGFAIPSGLFAPLATEMISTGAVRHPTLGVQVAAVTQQMHAQYGLPAGLFVQAATAPAADAGIVAGDVITAINGSPMRSPDDLIQVELKSAVGDEVTVSLARGSQTRDVTVRLASAS
ncbi:S1C family serine protease [Branchiibius cervicis]|uniref:S1C family serine protease n=1 Tax=Branchiibius cervicis TaxID=908252 RepID=A0ABW2AVA4_9MICO